MQNSFILYQEQEMAALNYAGLDMSECYTAIKNIAKKRTDKVLAYKEMFVNGVSKKLMEVENKDEETAIELATTLWTIIEDSANYSFNASHAYCVALDSLYGAWIKAHHPLEFYEVMLTIAEEKGDKDKMNALKNEAESFFSVKFPPFRYGQDNRQIKADSSSNSIINSISSIKGFNVGAGEILYNCAQQHFSSFIDVLSWLSSKGFKEAKVKPLILIGYFQQFGNINNLLFLLDSWKLFKEGEAKLIRKDKVKHNIINDILKEKCMAEAKNGAESTNYKVTGLCEECLKELEKRITEQPLPAPLVKEQVNNSLDILGYVDVVTNNPDDRKRLLITDVTKMEDSSGKAWGYRIGTHSIGTGKSARVTIRAAKFAQSPVKPGDILYATEVYQNKSGYWYLISYRKEI